MSIAGRSGPPTPLTEQQVERGMVLNITAGSVGTFWSAVAIGMPLPLFMEAIHASGQQLGAIGAIRQLSMLAQLPAAFIVERMAARLPFWAAMATAQRLLWIVPALLPLFWPGRPELYAVLTIVALGLSDILGNLATAPWLSWMADLLPADRAGRFWGRRQRMLSAMLILASGTFGLILDRFPSRAGLTGFIIVFSIATVGGVADIVIHAFVAEPRPVPHPRVAPVLERLIEPLRNADFRRLTWALGAWSCAIAMPGISNGLPGFFNAVYLKETFDASYTQASLLFIASAFGGLLWAPWIGRLIDRFGARRTGVWLMFAGPAATLAWCFVSTASYEFELPLLGQSTVPQAVLLMTAASVVIGGMYSGVLLCQLRLSALHTPTEGRTVPMAVHWALVGLLASLGPIVAGSIKDHFPVDWSRFTLPLGAPLSYFQLIILVQVAIVWFLAIPLLRGVGEAHDPRLAKAPSEP